MKICIYILENSGLSEFIHGVPPCLKWDAQYFHLLTVNIKFCFQLKFIVGHFCFIGTGLGRYEYLQLKHWVDCMRFKTFNMQLEKNWQ